MKNAVDHCWLEPVGAECAELEWEWKCFVGLRLNLQYVFLDHPGLACCQMTENQILKLLE